MQKETMIDGTYSVDEDEWRSWTIPLEQTREIGYEFSVIEGPSIDIFLMDSRAYGHFEEGESFNVNRDLSVYDAISEQTEGNLSAGDYHLVIDNTNAGDAKPPTDFENNYAVVEMTGWVYY